MAPAMSTLATGRNFKKRYFSTLLTVAATCGALALHLKAKTTEVTRQAEGIQTVGIAGKKAKAPKVAVDAQFFQRLVRILKVVFPHWKTKEVLLMGVLLFQLLVRLWFGHKLSSLGATNAQALVARDFKGLARGVFSFFLNTIPAALLNSSRKYVHAMLSLHIRLRLSAHANEEYLSGVNFYKAANVAGAYKMDHPDQRVTADISSFAEEFTTIIPTIIKPSMDLVLWTIMLVKTLGWQGPAFMYFYFLVSGLVKKQVMPSFGKLIAKESELEGYYSTAHNRLVSYSEEIAFYDGSSTERTIIEGGLNKIQEHAYSLYYLKFLIGIFDQLLVKYWASIAGYVTLSMPFLLGLQHTKKLGVGEVTRDYVYTSIYIGLLGIAIGDVILVGNKLSDLAGYVSRITELLDVIKLLNTSGNKPFEVKEDVEEESQVAVQSRDLKQFLIEWKERCDEQADLRFQMRHDKYREFHQPIGGGHVDFTDFIKFEECDIVSPDGQMLVEKLSFEVRPGMNVMITGPNGCGKSSLFRVIGELWPLQNGHLSKPKREDVLFVPQKPYLVLGTLRDQIIYPHSKDQMAKLGVTDDDLAHLLSTVDPPQKIVNTWKWDDIRDWFVTLSGGQKQRVAMARLFYHRPKFAILDECTSAVSAEIEDAIYAMAKDLGITIFTVSHRAALRRHHDKVLELDGRGNWSFSSVSHTQPNDKWEAIEATEAATMEATTPPEAIEGATESVSEEEHAENE